MCWFVHVHAAPILTTLLPSARIPLSNWTMLACTAPCPVMVHWYTKGSSYPLQTSWPGLSVHKVLLSNCTSENGTYSEVLEIFAAAQSNVSELQCASIPVCTDTDQHCRPQTCYSEFAQLMGKFHIRPIFMYFCLPSVWIDHALSSGSYMKRTTLQLTVWTDICSQFVDVTVFHCSVCK